MTKHTARQITDWFLAWSEQNNATLSNLKLQKLLYYTQGHHLGAHATPVFEDSIEDWVHGPVVPSIYHDLKEYGNAPIDIHAVLDDNFDWDDFRDIEDSDGLFHWRKYLAPI